jgi:hypothetical protein
VRALYKTWTKLPAPPAVLSEMKRASTTPEIYHASFTTYVDDYKLRGRDPSETVEAFFSTREGAEEFLLYHFTQALKDFDVEWFDENCFENYVCDGKLLEDVLDYNVCCEMIDKRSGQAEFVPCEFDYDIELVDVDSWVNPNSKKKQSRQNK